MEPHVAEQCARMSGEVQCRAWLALWTREKSELMNSERVVTLVGESKMLQSVRASSNVRSWVSGNGGASRARTECSILLRCKRAQADTYATLCVCVSVRVCVCERERETERGTDSASEEEECVAFQWRFCQYISRLLRFTDKFVFADR